MARGGRQGQSIVEYGVLLGLVAAALMAMQVYAKRGIQAGIKRAADEIGTQADGIRYEAGDRSRQLIAGTVVDRQTNITTTFNATVAKTQVQGGGHERRIDETTNTTGASRAEVVAPER